VRLSLAALGFGVLGAGRLGLTWLVKLWVEGPIATHEASQARRLLVDAGALTAGMFVALAASRYLLASVNQGLLERLRGRAVARIFEVELTAVRKFPVGEWISRVFLDVAALAGFVENVVKRLLGDGLVAIGAIAMMFWLDIRLALAVAALVPLVALLLASIGGSIRRWASIAQKEIGEATGALTEQLQGLTTIKGFQREESELRRFRAILANFRRKSLRAEASSSLLIGIVFLATGFGLLGVVAFGSRQILAGRTTQGALLAFCLYAVQAIEPMRRLSDVHGMLQRALAAAARIYEVIDLAPGERAGTLALPLPVKGELRFDHVHFRYREGEPVIESVDLSVSPGEPLAIVSASGGGKSTLARLLLRFERAGGGEIRLDGLEISGIRTGDLRRAVCVVEQDVFLFAGTVSENLRYGAGGASRSEIEAAAEIAGLRLLLDSLPRGLDSSIAEAARDLSGGEKQRIALARAVLRNPAVLVLDESLSALDGESEAGVLARLEPWFLRRTVIVMAHRLSTVLRFPRAALLERGRIVAQGDPGELLRTSAAFAQLFAGQAAWILAEPVA
jgi:subfamily B ATP-binding cassette protein MsbA